MLEQNEYLITWGAYFGAVLGLLLVWWTMTRPIPWLWLKQPLRLFVAAILLVPAPVAADRAELAPALIVWLFDSLLIKDVESERAMSYLLYGIGLGVIALMLDAALRFLFRRKSTSELT